MKIINTSDIHFTVRGPRLRIDDFGKAVMKKMEFLVQLALDESADAILITGDMTDSPNVSIYWTDQFMEILRGSGLPIMVVPGNHDLERSLASLDRVPLGHYGRVGWLQLLNAETPIVIKGVAFWGHPYVHQPGAPTTDLNVPGAKDYECNVLGTHQLYMEKEAPYVYRTLSGEEIPIYTKIQECETNCDLVLLSHQHDPKQGLTKNGKMAFAPGSPVRLERTEKDTRRYFGVIEIEPGEVPVCKKVQIPMPGGDQVFDLRKVVDEERYDEMMDQFVSSLKSISVKAGSIDQLVAQVAKENNVPEKVIKEAYRILNKVRECNH